MNCILYINKTGCQWRMIPKDFPPYNNVFNYFTKRETPRVSLGREESPSLGTMDLRSAKTSQHVDKKCGIDSNKKVKGRKDQVLVDTLGLPMAISVHEANIHDSKGAESKLKKLAHKSPRLRKILADSGYRGDGLKVKVRTTPSCKLEVVLRSDESPKKFGVIPLRWIVGRSFAWLYNFRRIVLDYEFYSELSEIMIQIAFSKIMLNKLSN